jgi:hypothetical protein
MMIAALLFCLAVPAVADDTLPQIPDAEPQSAIPVDPDQGKSYQVDCYLGSPNEGQNIGSLTVTGKNEAGPACNSTYDCKHNCYGCVNDGSNVCFDWLGGAYQR